MERTTRSASKRNRGLPPKNTPLSPHRHLAEALEVLEEDGEHLLGVGGPGELLDEQHLVRQRVRALRWCWVEGSGGRGGGAGGRDVRGREGSRGGGWRWGQLLSLTRQNHTRHFPADGMAGHDLLLIVGRGGGLNPLKILNHSHTERGKSDATTPPFSQPSPRSNDQHVEETNDQRPVVHPYCASSVRHTSLHPL